jgi:hypothetical protein
MINQLPTIIDAIKSLRPNSEWVLQGFDYSKLQWFDLSTLPPTTGELEVELDRLIKEHNNNEYQRLRAQEYPPVTDYLDAVVKGDLEQQQAYIDACLAVKAKYPKPEGV